MINGDINELAKKVLDKGEFGQLLKVIAGIQNRDRENSLANLVEVLGMTPKRPLYYIADAIYSLPEKRTRDIIRYSADYIDHLIRFTLEDKKFLSKWFRSPLGPNIKKLKKYIDSDLYEHLMLFNRIYTQAKHEFHHDEDKSFFSCEDAVYVIYITKKLAERILPLSERARDYANDGETAHRYCYMEED